MCNSQERCSIGEQKQGYWIPQESPARTTRASSPACCFFRDNFFGFTKKTSTILTQLNHLPNWKRIELHVKSSASEATSIGYHRDKSNHVWPKEKVNNLYTGADDGTSKKGICRNRFYNATCHYSSLGKLLRFFNAFRMKRGKNLKEYWESICKERQCPPADVAQIIDSANENLWIYCEIQRAMILWHKTPRQSFLVIPLIDGWCSGFGAESLSLELIDENMRALSAGISQSFYINVANINSRICYSLYVSSGPFSSCMLEAYITFVPFVVDFLYLQIKRE
ncbi:hypothetical protein V6N13_079535 [Hibiscus sabdariffa]